MSVENQLEFTAWVLLGVALGSFIGLEREFRGHEAGIRTLGMVCGGATMIGRLSLVIGDDRMAAAVVQGVGFLGAGLILHRRGGQVHGATSAATVWVIAALGLLVGAELWLTSVILTAVFFVLLELYPVSERILDEGRRRRSRDYGPRD